jgi:hypothetical protein
MASVNGRQEMGIVKALRQSSNGEQSDGDEAEYGLVTSRGEVTQ